MGNQNGQNNQQSQNRNNVNQNQQNRGVPEDPNKVIERLVLVFFVTFIYFYLIL